jgi:hypothetical protein
MSSDLRSKLCNELGLKITENPKNTEKVKQEKVFKNS